MPWLRVANSLNWPHLFSALLPAPLSQLSLDLSYHAPPRVIMEPAQNFFIRWYWEIIFWEKRCLTLNGCWFPPIFPRKSPMSLLPDLHVQGQRFLCAPCTKTENLRP